MPPLAFANEIAIVHKSARNFADLMDSVFPGVNAYDPLTDASQFLSKSSVLSMSNSKVVAAAITPTNVDRNGNQFLTFMMPYAGKSEAFCRVGDQQIQWGLGLGGVFMPETDERVGGSGGFRSQIMWQLNREQLEKTAAAMLGQQVNVDLRLEDARLLPSEVSGVRVDASLSALIPFFQMHREQPYVLTQLGIEDLLYRQSVMLLRPDLFSNDSTTERLSKDATKRKKLLQVLCEYIADHLTEPLTLTDLERVSGVSARTLQSMFIAEYDCSPMVWLKEQRLQKVRRYLLSNQVESIEGAALAAGFQTMPSFFLAYKNRFGETPGQTRRK